MTVLESAVANLIQLYASELCDRLGDPRRVVAAIVQIKPSVGAPPSRRKSEEFLNLKILIPYSDGRGGLRRSPDARPVDLGNR